MKALIFDTETTDLLSNSQLPLNHQPRIIEFFGHIVEDDGTVIEELGFRCNPGIPIPEKITQITRITNADVVQLPRFAEHMTRVAALIASAEAVVAHNLPYDFAVVNYEFARYAKTDRELPKWPAIKICTVQETEYMVGHRLSLTALHERLFGEGFPNAHSARSDVNALTRVWVKLRAMGVV